MLWISSVPDFRNQGIWLRVLLLANGMMLAAAVVANHGLESLPAEIVELAAIVEPSLLAVLASLYVASPWLQNQRPFLAAFSITVLVVVTGVAMEILMAALWGGDVGWRFPVGAGLSALFLLVAFSLRQRVQAPALAEARLAALNARIRPHFLFNSLNAVLGVIREDPRRAEAALEELADLFRALMRDNRTLVPLVEEIALARKYLEIERLRLGDRLLACWRVEDFPPDMLAPPLLLQPLLENAVYHGIEPTAEPGEIRVTLSQTRDGVRIEIENPRANVVERRCGNRMALDNLRERLMLFYDLEARLEIRETAERYRVRVDLPRRMLARSES